MTRRWLLYLLSLPPSLPGFVVLGMLVLLRAARVHPTRESDIRGKLCVSGVPGGWLERHWRYSTTFGPHALLMHSSATPAMLVHELVHTRQAEGVSIAWGLAALLSWSWRMALCWPACWACAYAGSAIAAWLAGRPGYLGNTFEDHAYEVERQHRREQLALAASRGIHG
jgi:hypothetical protein